jgi:hypothetical protein
MCFLSGEVCYHQQYNIKFVNIEFRRERLEADHGKASENRTAQQHIQ